MSIFSASAEASVECELVRNSLPCQDDNKVNIFSASAEASVECELVRNSLPCQDDNKVNIFSASAEASVVRNFAWALLKQKGIIK